MTGEELTAKFVELDERVTRHTEQLKTAFTRIAEVKDITESVHKLATSVEVLTIEQKNTNQKMDKLTGEIEGIKEKPGKRWDEVVKIVISAIIGALITFVATQMGLK